MKQKRKEAISLDKNVKIIRMYLFDVNSILLSYHQTNLCQRSVLFFLLHNSGTPEAASSMAIIRCKYMYVKKQELTLIIKRMGKFNVQYILWKKQDKRQSITPS